MIEQVRRCQVCGEDEVIVCVAVWRGGREQGRTFVCYKCAEREERFQGRVAGVSLSGISAFMVKRQSQRAGADPDKGCPVCGSRLTEIAVDGLLGCGYCYLRFPEEVAVSINTTQGSMRHIGKSPFE